MNAARLRIAEELETAMAGVLSGKLGHEHAAPADEFEDGMVGAVDPVPTENVVRPVAFRGPPVEPVAPSGRARPELTAALQSVARATEAFRAVEQQADRRAQRAIDIAFRSMAQVEAFEAKLRSAEARVEELTGRNEDEIRRFVAELDGRDDTILDLEDQIAELKALVGRQDDLLREQAEKLALAEAQAAEALQDLRFLSGKVSNALDLPHLAG